MGHGNFLNLTCDIGDPRHGRHRAKIILSPASKAPVLGDFFFFFFLIQIGFTLIHDLPANNIGKKSEMDDDMSERKTLNTHWFALDQVL